MTDAHLRDRSSKRHFGFLRVQDVVWLLFIGALFFTAPENNYDSDILIPLIGAFQILEPRWKLFASRRGQIASVALKMILGYLLMGYTDAILTYYWPILLVPIVSAATTFEKFAVIAVTTLAGAAYFSFLLTFDYSRSILPPDTISLVSLHVSFYAIVAYLVYEQARAKRDEIARAEEAARRLAESNRSLQLAEASLRRSERLAALGQLTAGLAHELRNPLSTIRASAETLSKSVTNSRPELSSEMAGYIVSEVERMNGLISNFLDFARPLQLHPVTVELRPVLENVLRQQSDAAASRHVEMSLKIDSEPLSFTFDPDLLKLAVSNLVQNAIQASDPGGSVDLRVDNLDHLVRIFVTDHGKGIEPQHLESIFNPFFTTRTDGVGLGLAIVSKIVDEHHGRISVFSQPCAGTTFEMKLPRVQPE